MQQQEGNMSKLVFVFYKTFSFIVMIHNITYQNTCIDLICVEIIAM